MRISIIIVNFFSEALVLEAVRSLDRARGDVEVVVVDNTPASNRYGLRESLPSHVTYTANNRNLGFAKACNQAYAMSSGDYLLLLNPDASLLPGALDALTDFLDAHPRSAAAAPRIYWDKQRRFLHPPATLPSPGVIARERVLREYPTPGRFLAAVWRHRAVSYWRAERPLPQKALSGGVVMLRREALEDSGGLFDERFFMYYEDSDLFLRFRKRKWGSFCVPRAEAIHYYDQAGRGREGVSADKERFMAESSHLYMQKHFARSRLIAWAKKAGSIRVAKISQPVLEEDGLPIFFPPEGVKGGWLLLFGINESLTPAAAHFGTGGRFVFPREIASRLAPGTYYFSVFQQNGDTILHQPVWCWERKDVLG